MVTHLKPPKMPEEYECCGNGCDSCVWDTYFKDQVEYKRRKRELSATRASHDSRASTGKAGNMPVGSIGVKR